MPWIKTILRRGEWERERDECLKTLTTHMSRFDYLMTSVRGNQQMSNLWFEMKTENGRKKRYLFLYRNYWNYANVETRVIKLTIIARKSLS